MPLTPYILIHQLSYILQTGKSIFEKLSVAFSNHKTGIVGKNGIGKSTLLKLIMHELSPTSGSIHVNGEVAYVSQKPNLNPFDSVAKFLGYEEKLIAYDHILSGSTDEHDFITLNEEWNIKLQYQQCISKFALEHIPPKQYLGELSGGELTRLLLTKVFSSNAKMLILDEPTNHLDSRARHNLYSAINQWQHGLIIVSHDKVLLNLMDEIIELNTLGAHHYGGNYENYIEQKAIEKAARERELQDSKKLLENAKQTIQNSREIHEQKKSHGRKLRKSGRIDKLSANSAKGRSERTQSKLVIKKERLLNQANKQLEESKTKIEMSDEIIVKLPATYVPNKKILIELQNIDFVFPHTVHLIKNFNLTIQGPEHIALEGANGSGKTTLLKLIQGELNPTAGKIFKGTPRIAYLDQNACTLNSDLSVLENFQHFNPDINETTARLYLAQFLFKNTEVLKKADALSGGERLRLLLACLLMAKEPPQLLLLDEPTNHLDFESINRIESALRNFEGAMIVISHDDYFLRNIGITKTITAPFEG